MRQAQAPSMSSINQQASLPSIQPSMDTSSIGAQDQPPALPAKQRRSLYSQSSSISSEEQRTRPRSMNCLSPFPSPDVYSGSFSVPTSPGWDCFEPQCPIHHQYGPACHEERYFSEKTPPPVPKKKLARTMSLPGQLSGTSYTCPALLPNPLSMLSPLEDVVFDPGSGVEDRASEVFLPIPSPLPNPQLGFDTPDEQLPCFFSNLSNQAQVSENLQQHLLQFLQNTLERMGRGVEGVDTCLGKIWPQDDDLPQHAQDGIWQQRVRCPSLHGQEFTIKVSTAESAAPVSHLPQHFHPNVQQVISQFLVTERVPVPERGGGILTPEGSTERGMQQKGAPEGATDEREPSVPSLNLKQGYHVTVNWDVTQSHMEEFVLVGRDLHRSHPEVYHRRLVLLLLQVAQALLHLKTHDIQVVNLDPHSILLTWAQNVGGREKMKDREIGELQKRNEGLNSSISSSDRKDTGEKQDNEHIGKHERLWMKWGTPRVVVTLPYPATAKSFQPHSPSLQFQLACLLQYCLHLPEAHVSCTNTLPDTFYSQGLLCLLSQLLIPKSQLQIADTVPFLQAMIWGPQASLFQHSLPDPTTVDNWLLIKRSLLLLKLSEKGLFSDQPPVNWEDYLCLQYFSLTDPHTVLNATAKLGLHNAEI